jgi:hypothetical protein
MMTPLATMARISQMSLILKMTLKLLMRFLRHAPRLPARPLSRHRQPLNRR